MNSNGYTLTIRVKHMEPVQPLAQVQVLGAEHSLLVPHEGLQIATCKFCDVIMFCVHQ